MKIKLNSIAEEAVACRKAFKNFPVGGYVLHCHHEQIGETLTESAENRIAYILSQKPEHEQALRLRLFRPVSEKKLKAYAERQKAYAEWQKAYAEWQKADAERQKAYAEWQKAYAEWQKAYAERQKADAEWQKAYAERQKAYAELGKLVHKKYCVKNCPWDGKTIFPKS